MLVTRKLRRNIVPLLLDFLGYFVTVAGEIYGLKSIAAYRSGLEINANVSTKDAEGGLAEVLSGQYSM